MLCDLCSPGSRSTRFAQQKEEFELPPSGGSGPATRGLRHIQPLRQQGPSPVLLSDEEPTPRSRARADAAIARRLQEREDAVARRAAESAARSEFSVGFAGARSSMVARSRGHHLQYPTIMCRRLAAM